MRKAKVAAIAALVVTMGIGGSIAALGGANQIIRYDKNGKRIEETEAAAGESEAIPEYVPESVKMYGPVLDKQEDRFKLNNTVGGGYQGEVVIHISPEKTLILDGTTGEVSSQDEIRTSENLHVYTGMAMAMSLPPQATADLILTNVDEQGIIPQYITLKDAVTANEQGGFTLTASDGTTFRLPADCFIQPHLTRQMVMPEHLQKNDRLLVWAGEDGTISKIIYFNR